MIAPLLFFAPAIAVAETISGAMAKAYQYNPDLNAVRAALRATDENVTIAKSGFRPQIGASAGVTGIDIRDGLNYRTHSAGVSITQQVFDGFQTLNNVRSAESGVLASRENLRANEISLLLSAAQAYAVVARNQQIVVIRRQNLNFLEEQVKAAESRLVVNEGTRTDVAQSQAEAAAAKAALSTAIAALKSSEATYVQIVGDAPKGIKQPVPAKRGLPSNLDNAVATGIKEHPSVLASLHSVDAAGYQVKSAEGILLPGVVIQGSVNQSGTTQPGFFGQPQEDTVAGSVTAQLRIPIYQGGAEYGRVRQAKERLGQQRILVDSVRASVQQTIVSAYAQYEAAKASIVANREQIAAAKVALSGVLEERNVGQATTLDVLTTQRDLLEAQESLVLSQYIAVVASYSVIASMGRLTVTGQGLQVAEYRPEKHYEAVKDKWFGLRTVDGR
ncbi:TolC family outer membrane protein [Rhizobiaceae bacterium n13]|uniref:TolC family outer membrane protein n=2 Tax=Ferirhizobium litorale TaxID=2927786 RepID=A0AAE3QBW1_9HYPH|nr:TolC family outer membrane protein [Fererhizobium litorale]MDI7922922.1 TolC family outer membrane protein [Fererhizobium litorale]